MVTWSPELPMSQGRRGPQGRLLRKGDRRSMNVQTLGAQRPGRRLLPQPTQGAFLITLLARSPVVSTVSCAGLRPGSGVPADPSLGPTCTHRHGPPSPPEPAETVYSWQHPHRPLSSRQGSQPVLPSVSLKTSVFGPGNNFTIKKKKNSKQRPGGLVRR